jgi:hypothetical protein
MRFTDKEVLARQPIWAAMSELYLDNDDLPFGHVAQVCAESGFSLDELETILFLEVDPVLSLNRYQVGFVSDGFDKDWLRKRIQSESARLVLQNAAFYRWVRGWMYPWRHLRKAIIERRAMIQKPSVNGAP